LDNQLAIAHVAVQVKSQLKHVRQKAQNVLLTGMNPNDPPGRVPGQKLAAAQKIFF
jgi:hypothetical protein